MPTFPTAPAPNSVSAPAIIGAVLRQQYDQGYEHRRPRYSRDRRRYTLEYAGLNADQLHIFTDFLQRETRMGALSFDWEHPSAHTVSFVQNVSPIVVETSHRNDRQTRDWVRVAGVQGTTAANGLWQITWLTDRRFQLNGSVGNGAYTGGGTVAHHLPVAKVVLPGDTWAPPTKFYGPETDANGLFQFTIVIEELF